MATGFTRQGVAAVGTVLRHVAGEVGYTQTAGAPYVAVAGEQLVSDGSFAVVGQRSRALLTLPDSSLVGIGANSRIEVNAIRQAENASSTISIPQSGGTLRFDVKHPKGAVSNYTFVTPSSNVAVRGTIGLISSSATNGDVISCLACSPNDVVVTIGSNAYPLVSGQTLVVTSAGAVSTVSTTGSILQSFSEAGLSTDPSAAAPVVLEPPHDATGQVLGAAAAAAAGAVLVDKHGAGPTPLPTSSGLVNLQSRPKR
ncbi:MAG TPA: FecR domain-containing protein [Candidatus Baltobacteraceae bacterium]